MRIHTCLATVIMMTASAVGITASPATASSICRPVYTAPVQFDGQVSVEGFLICSDPDDPRDGSPLFVALQRQGIGTSWVTVATGSGEAVYLCAGTSARTYRNSRLPTRLVTLNCS